MSAPIELVLVRHGETTGQSHIRLNGVTDVPLSAVGRAQMERGRALLEGERFDHVFSSDLRRSIESAQIVSGRAPQITPGFREMDFGIWETLTWEEVAARDPELLAEFRAEPRAFAFPEGDSTRGFYERVRATAFEALASRPGRTLAALHKGVCKIIIGAFCELPWEAWRSMRCDLGSVHRLRREAGGWRLVEHNLVEHLGELWLSDH